MKLYYTLYFLIIVYFYKTSYAIPTSSCVVGCRGGVRAMLNETINNGTEFLYPNITACLGVFHGYIGGPEAGSLCADYWHVCNTFDLDLIRSVPFSVQNDPTTSANLCYAFNAAQDFGLCRYCTGNIHEDDMAAFGAGCNRIDEYSCYTPTINNNKLGYCCHAYLTNRGCEGNDYELANELNGVVCCADNAQNPCFYGNCPNGCCDNGVCDTSFGTCTCNPGFVNSDCCVQCSALTCSQCLNTSDCGWCTGSNTCTSTANPSCHTPITENPSLISTICPTNNPVHVNSVNVGAAVGGALGAFAALLAVGAFFLYRRYNTGEYEGFWKNYNKLDEGLTDNPLYQKQNIEVVSPLYDRK